MKTTIQDVADKAEVSTSTVSRVFNNKRNITEATREKVLKAAEELNYTPRQYNKKNDRSLKNNIGIIFSNKLLSSLIIDPFYGQVIKGIEESFSDYNYQLFFKTISGNYKADKEIISDLVKDNNLAGIMFVGYNIDKKIILNIKKSGVPVILVDNDLWDENIDCVINDNFSGARKIVEYLVENGHHKIAFLGGPLSHASLNNRFEGYKRALSENNIQIDQALISICEPSFNVQDGYNGTLSLFKSDKLPATAIFAANDMLAIGALRALRDLDLKVPAEVAVVGFDNIEMSQHTLPSLTTVSIFKKEMGALAGKRLHELIKGKNEKAIKLVVSVETTIRESS